MPALTFPLPVSWFASLPISECTFHLPSASQVSRTRGGQILTAPLAERLWTGSLVLMPLRNAEAAALSATLSLLQEPGASFLAHSLPLCTPQADPTGAILGSSTPIIDSISTDARELRIAALPSNYVLTAGDFIGWTYGSNPTRYALHQIVTGGQANGAGLSPWLEVTPAIRPGVNVGALVTLVKPAAKCVLLPSEPPTARSLFTQGITLEFVQTLR